MRCPFLPEKRDLLKFPRTFGVDFPWPYCFENPPCSQLDTCHAAVYNPD
jgi:hypothetical protein